jgi:N utilization substance protein B
MSGGIRSRGRAYALQVLYALDLNERPSPADEIETIRALFASDLGDLEPGSVAFARELVCGVRDNLEAVDESIVDVSRNWRLERMSRVDRNILRLATVELRDSLEVPIKVAINEAVELAKRFGAHESPAFVNGLLDRIAQRMRPGEKDRRKKKV